MIARALALNPSGVILPEDLPEAIRRGGGSAATGDSGASTLLLGSERPPMADLEKRYAQLVLRENGGNKSRAAEILGIDRKTLYRLLGEKDEK